MSAISKKFVPTKEASDTFGVSSDVLKDRVESKEFKHGEHYIDIRSLGSTKPVYLWNTEAILEYWLVAPEYRGNNAIKSDGRRSRRALKLVG